MKTQPQFSLSSTEDIPQLKALWYYCFPEDRQGSFIEWYFDQFYNPQTTYIAKIQSKIVAAVYAPAHKMVVGGKILASPYIQGVAVSPDFRGQGLAKNLLNYALADLQRQKVALAILKPFDPGFYKALGWSFFAKLYKYKMPLNSIATNKPSGNLEYLYAPNPWDYTKDMAEVYGAWLKNNLLIDNYVDRNLLVWHQLLTDHRQDEGELLLAYEQNTPVGYMLYSLQGDTLFIRELAYTKPEALKSLLSLAKDHGAQVKNLLLTAPAVKNAALLLPEVLNGAEVCAFAMAKLLDISEALSGLPVAKPWAGAIYLQVLDPKGCNPEQIISIEAIDGQTKAQAITLLDGVELQKVLAIEINLLTKAYMGCYNFRDYKCNGLVVGCEEIVEVLDSILPKRQNYFYEYF